MAAAEAPPGGPGGGAGPAASDEPPAGASGGEDPALASQVDARGELLGAARATPRTPSFFYHRDPYPVARPEVTRGNVAVRLPSFLSVGFVRRFPEVGGTFKACVKLYLLWCCAAPGIFGAVGVMTVAFLLELFSSITVVTLDGVRAVLRIPARRVGVEVPRLYSTYTSLDSPQQFDYSFSEASLVSPAWSEEPSPAPSPAPLSPEKKRA